MQIPFEQLLQTEVLTAARMAHVCRLSKIDSSINLDSSLNNPVIADFGLTSRNRDDSSFASLKYDATLGDKLQSSTHAYYGQYLYRTHYFDSNTMPTGTRINQASDSRRWGVDSKLVFGAEYRDDYREKFHDPTMFSFDQSTYTASLYGQDEFRLRQDVQLNYGVRTSLAHQVSENTTGVWRVNSPKLLGKANLAAPLFQNRLTAGLEAQYISRRRAMDGSMVASDTMVNLTLNSDKILPGMEVLASLRNLFDHQGMGVSSDPNLRAFTQDGRNLWVQISHDFR